MELLAPVGDEACLKAAVENGADAVYLGGELFSARRSAGNFSLEALSKALLYAHLREVKIYVAVNTLVANSEMADLFAYLKELLIRGVDGVIVQDSGVIHLIRTHFPDLPLHVSTQATVHNLAGIAYLEGLGVKRVVLSRELSLAEIREIKEQSELELEVFGHGALCVSYSGQCLFSSMIGGRSGNRGCCAQPCRMPYQLVDEAGELMVAEKEAGAYLLSPRDLKTLDCLPDLLSAGVHSLKIEGRMKKPAYVATVVRIYRQAIDRLLENAEKFAVLPTETRELTQVFNRDFTNAYLQGTNDAALMSYRRPNNRGLHLGRIESYSFADKTAVIRLENDLVRGDGLEVWVSQGGRVGKKVDQMLVSGEAREKAVAGERVMLQLDGKIRTGDRVFKTYDDVLEKQAKQTFLAEAPIRKSPVKMKVIARLGEKLVIEIVDHKGRIARGYTEFLAEKAKKRPLTYDYLWTQLGKLGNTIFSLTALDLEIEGELMVPISEINQARRQAVEELEKKILAEKKRFFTLPDRREEKAFFAMPSQGENQSAVTLSVLVSSLAQVKEAVRHGADRIYFGGDFLGQKTLPTIVELQQAIEFVLEEGKAFYLATPRVLKTQEFSDWDKLFVGLGQSGLSGVLAGNLGILQRLREEFSYPIALDTGFNLFNNAALSFWQQELGSRLTVAALSPELTLHQLKEMRLANVALEVLVEGQLILTVMEHCPLHNLLGKGKKEKCPQYCQKQSYYLRDRLGIEFPLKTNPYCRSYLLNAMSLSVLEHLKELQDLGLGSFRLELGGQREIGKVVSTYKRAMDLLRLGEDYLSDKQVQAFLGERKQFTKGHYFRGV